MTDGKTQADATLLDLLIDGFEKSEVLHGWHWRELPMPDQALAVRTFVALADEARRWKGEPLRSEESHRRRLASWPDLEIRQVGRATMVRAKAPGFSRWWHDRTTWEGDPMRPIFDWIREEHGA